MLEVFNPLFKPSSQAREIFFIQNQPNEKIKVFGNHENLLTGQFLWDVLKEFSEKNI